jgi:putative ABC transport system ATP-binding protein
MGNNFKRQFCFVVYHGYCGSILLLLPFSSMEKNGAYIIEVHGLHKSFQVGAQTVPVLKDISLNVAHGDFVVIFGPSGCGKSTLLHIILGLETPTQGEVIFLDSNLYQNTDEDSRSDFRKKHLGMVYQQSNWIRSLTVRENVYFPLLLLGMDKPKAMGSASEVLRNVSMEDWQDYMPTELSSGQQQRVGLARALINNPEIIIADEPTGNLDYESGQTIMNLLAKLNKESGKTIIMVTHDLEYITFAKTIVRMLDGQVIGIYGEQEKEKLLNELHFKRGVEITGEKGDDANVAEVKEGESKEPVPVSVTESTSGEATKKVEREKQ